jgi:glycine/sarcosine/betaine reductase complex component C subunit beta
MAVVVRGARLLLVHAPGLVAHGSKPARELARDPALPGRLRAHLRGYGAAAAYPPHRVFLGALSPDALAALPRPWFAAAGPVEPRGPHGFLVPEEILYGLLKADDEFDLVWLDERFAAELREALAQHPLVARGDLDRVGAGKPASALRARVETGEALPLALGDGRLVGCVGRAHEDDPALTASVLLENLTTKTTAVLALRTLIADGLVDAATLPYVINSGEEAVGDRYQRGGGNLAKAIAERGGCVAATGTDVKAFCCGPVHAFVAAAALVAAGVFAKVAVVGGSALAKLGMKFQGHLAKGQPVVEDVLAGFAAVIGRDDGFSPVIRLDAIGRHAVGAGGAQQAILEALAVRPLSELGLRLTDIDRYATELHNPEATEPAGSGNVPLLNYRLLGALAVARGEIARADLASFVARHGLPGFSPTQGHIASAVPFLAHAVDGLTAGSLRRVMFLAKGSLFLGRMTHMSDGLSFILERNPENREAPRLRRGAPSEGGPPRALSRADPAAPGRPERWGAWGAPGAPH